MRLNEYQPLLESLESSGLASDPVPVAVSEVEAEAAFKELEAALQKQLIVSEHFEQQIKICKMDLDYIQTHRVKTTNLKKFTNALIILPILIAIVNAVTIQSIVIILSVFAFQMLYLLFTSLVFARYNRNMPSKLFEKGKLTL